MDTPAVDYSVVLADLKRRRDELNAAITLIERISLGGAAATGGADLGLDGSQPTSEGAPRDALPTKVESDTFFSLSIPEAAKKYLRMKKRPAGTRELSNALMEGGYLSQSKNFYTNVFASLRRNPDFVLVKSQWALAEWYPGRRSDQTKTKANGKEETATGSKVAPLVVAFEGEEDESPL
jgi:hypothetical protein